MKTIIDLLKEKNQSLEKFYRLNESELEKFTTGNFETLETFYASREGLLEIIKKIDELIERSNDEVLTVANSDAAIEAAIKTAIENELLYKNGLVNRILEQDLNILSAIESEKSHIIKELCQVRATRKAAGAYGRTKNGTNLDEEA